MKLHQEPLRTFSRQLIQTEDGSHTLYVPELDEHYHSQFGAIQESRHVYIDAGYNLAANITAEPLSILEIGLGAGLNAFLTYLESQKKGRVVNYHAIELFPLPLSLTKIINYAKQLNDSESDMFQRIHKEPWGAKTYLSPEFSLTKINADLLTVLFETKFDLVYFDAFGPDVQPELWEKHVLKKIFNCMKIDGVFTTYSAKGSVKRSLKELGLTVEKLTGPPGKREMIRAIKRSFNGFTEF